MAESSPTPQPVGPPSPPLPPFGRMNMNTILFEAVSYGINCVLFVTCLYVLKRRMKDSSRFLFAGSIVLFCLSTAHFAISWIQLVQAYTETPIGPDAYFAQLNSRLGITQSVIYILNVFGQDLMLVIILRLFLIVKLVDSLRKHKIWRLYMVLGRNWKICVVPLIIECVHITCAFISIGLLAAPLANLFSLNIQAWGKASWSLDLALNTTLTCIIAFYLWDAGRKTAFLTRSSRNKYTESILTMVESGAIYAVATLIVFALDIAGSPAGFVGVTGIIQLATLTPLLIIVRVGLGLTRQHPTTVRSTTLAPTTLINSNGVQVTISRVAESGSYDLRSFTHSDKV